MSCFFYPPFYSISVISGRWEATTRRLCAIKPRLRWNGMNSVSSRIGHGTSRSACQRLTHWATEAPFI